MCGSDKNTKKESAAAVEFDEAIKLTGYGRFHYEVIVASAISIVAAGFQNGLSGYLCPAAQCDLQLSSEQIGYLNVAFLVGGISSSFLWGVMADISGRRRVLILTLLFDFTITFFSALLINNFTGFVACRFLNGFFIGAPGSITFSYLAEFQPPRYRSKSVCYSGIFLTSSWLLLPLITYGILSTNVDVKLGYIPKFTSWRLLLIVLILPELVAGLWLLRLPESPKFLFASGNTSKALDILALMFTTNTGKDTNEYPAKKLVENPFSQSKKSKMESKDLFKDSKMQMSKLFRTPLLFCTILSCSIMFANMFGLYGLGLWFPELFNRFEQFQLQYPNLTVTIRELARIKETNQNCTFTMDGPVFINTMSLGICSLLANLVSGVLAGRVSLRTIPFVTMLLGGATAGSIYLLKSSLQNLVVSCLFLSTMATGNVVIGSVVIELFPTCVGAVAICLVLCAGRLGAIVSNIVFGYFMDKQCEIPIFLVASVVLLGSFLCLIFPRSKESAKTKAHKEGTKINADIFVSENFKYSNYNVQS